MNRRLRAIPALLLSCTLGVLALPFASAAANAATPSPQWNPAQAAARFLAAQVVSPTAGKTEGYIPVAGSPGTPNLSDTAQSILAMAAANVDRQAAQYELQYLYGHVNQYVEASGADGPGQLAILILDSHVYASYLGFTAGNDLVKRLLATQQTSGPDAGLFGTETQLADFSAGTYQQGLALLALTAVGITSGPDVAAATGWLEAQQCPNGGWSLPDAALDACNGLPADFSGPDTNSTALALEGLASQGALPPASAENAVAYLRGGQDADAGWSYYANSVAIPATSDPDSTALVMQALVAMGLHPSAFTKGSADPLGTLLTFQLHSGTSAGGFYFPPAPAPASNLATYQAVPALMGLPLPLAPVGSYLTANADGTVKNYAHPSGGSVNCPPPNGVHDVVGIASTADGNGYWLVGADGGVFTCGDAHFLGSIPGLGLHEDIVGLSPTADGRGYWLVAVTGAVFAFGDARFLGSLPGLGLNTESIVSMAPSPSGLGYTMVSAQGGVFAFGDARYTGSLPGVHVTVNDVLGVVRTADGGGYWLFGRDGGVFAFGDAPFLGSLPSVGAKEADVTAVTGASGAAGYLLATGAGNVYSFGTTAYNGGDAGPIVGVAVPSSPSAGG
jgi:hypothetical protein